MIAETYNDLLDLCRLQLNIDQDDFAEAEDVIESYLNDGFYQLMRRRKNGVMDDVTQLQAYAEIPLPAWVRSAIADYACYLYYRNGNALKQQRGQEYLSRFRELEAALPTEAAEAAQTENGGRWRMKNLYTH